MGASPPEFVVPLDLSMTILIVDDHGTMLRILRNLLREIGFHAVDEAADGVEALARLQAGPYGLVISDWNMAPMTGLELLRAVRTDPRLATLPFIMMTAENRIENVVAARQAGASNFMVKPISRELLLRKIESVFRHA